MVDRIAWLWCSDNAQAFLSTGSQLYGPARLLDEGFVQTLRRDASIHAVLPEVLAQAFTAPDWDTLVLDNSLSMCWQRLEWESLHINGKALGEKCCIVRLAKNSNTSLKVAKGRPLVVTQLAKDDPIQHAIKHLLAHENILVSHRGTSKEIDEEWRADRDLASEFSDLLLFAHGGENGQIMVLDAQGKSWLDASMALPRLPPRVWLFVCSDLNGNLTPLVQRFLAHGARQVLYGHGKLEAMRMVEKVTSWLAKETDALTCDLTGTVGKNSLRLAGDVFLTYPDQLTLEQDQNPGCDPLKRLNTSHRNLMSQVQELDKLGSCVNQCWPRTLNWLLPYLCYLAESSQNQVLQAGYRRQWETLDDKVRHESPATAYFFAEAAHREGRYVHQVRYLNQVLGLCLNALDMQGMVFKTLLSISNVLIDMNLPLQNARLILTLETQLDALSALQSPEEKFPLLDVKARQALREGKGHDALHHYKNRIKQESLEKDRGPLNAARAYATALFAAAWICDASADEWAQKCLEIQASIPVQHHPYLCRALALYCWRCPDGTQYEPAQSACNLWLDFVMAHDEHCDIGPIGITTAALLLCKPDSARFEQLSELWESNVRLGFQDQRYWFELASWSCLLKDKVEAARALERFHAQRKAIVDELMVLPHLQHVLNCASLDSECQERTEQELALLNEPTANIKDWLKQGFLPL